MRGSTRRFSDPPAQWRDYSALRIEPGKHFENMRAPTLFEWNRQASRLN